MASINIIAPTGNQSDGTQVGRAGEKVAFIGATPVAIRAGAAQTALATNLANDANGTAIAAAVNGAAAAFNEVRATLVALGLWTGAAE